MAVTVPSSSSVISVLAAEIRPLILSARPSSPACPALAGSAVLTPIASANPSCQGMGFTLPA